MQSTRTVPLSRGGSRITNRPLNQGLLLVFASVLYAIFVVSNSLGANSDIATNDSRGGSASAFDLSTLLGSGLIPAGPIKYGNETKEQRKNWERVLDRCTPIDTEVSLSPSCYSALTKYFMDEPVWEYSFELGYQRLTSVYGLQEGIVNARHRGLNQYGYDDYALDVIPLWRDVFDGGLKERIDVFLRTVRDSSCNEEILSNETGIQSGKSQRCAARELYKYASFLESCTTAFTRLFILRSPPVGDGFLFDNLNTYEAFLWVISEYESIDDEESRASGGIERMRKGYLHASWVAKQCGANSYALLSGEDSLATYTWSELGEPSENGDLRELISRTFYVALGISAKTGDEWAVRSYPLQFFEYSKEAKFLRDVRKRYPILMHKSLGFEGGSELTYSEERRHRAKAFLLIEELAGTDAAQRDFDVPDLSNEIDYVRSGGALKYPFSWSSK